MKCFDFRPEPVAATPMSDAEIQQFMIAFGMAVSTPKMFLLLLGRHEKSPTVAKS